MRLAIFASLLGLSAPASAKDHFAPGSVCHASLDISENYETIARDAARWSCAGDDYDWKKPRFVVRHDLRERPANASAMRYAEFERHEFKALTVTVIDRDGGAATETRGFRDVRIGMSSLQSVMRLPQTSAPPEVVIFTLDGGKWPEALAAAEIVEKPKVKAIAGLPHLLAALLCGLLLAPMIFDFGYWRALREPFPLFHALFCAMAFIQTAAVSGLIPLLTTIPFQTELIVTYLSLDVLVAATVLFAASFIEATALTTRSRSMLGAIALLGMTNGVLTTFLPEWWGVWIDHVYFGGYILLLAGYFIVLGQAWNRGSRMAPYLIFGFAPLTSIIVFQFVGVVYSSAAYSYDETWPQNLALLFEVVATALAVADRFMAIRHERDKAVSQARDLVTLSERDELTGLRNRRSLELRWDALIEQGFTSMAVLDIDHFKSINDFYGHPVGDAVLKCTAEALRSRGDDNLTAFRIGGEEFLLMLRGEDAREKAEARRRAITVRTLSDLEGFDRPVTASMGFLQFSAVCGQPDIDFTALYTRCDQLLYDAKCAGRNRTFADRLELFVPVVDDQGSVAAA